MLGLMPRTFLIAALDRFLRDSTYGGSTPAAYHYRRGIMDARREIERAEKELQERIWQAWVNEGVEPR